MIDPKKPEEDVEDEGNFEERIMAGEGDFVLEDEPDADDEEDDASED